MPTVDERLEQLLADAAVEPAATDVFGAVVHKRRRRHARRVTRNIGALVAMLLVVAGSLAWLTTDDPTEPAVAPSTVPGPVAARVTGTDAWLHASEIQLAPDQGYVRGPLITSGEYVALATYDRDGSGFKIPPARVVRIDATGRVLDEVELQGEILSLADGESARWVVTHDADNVSARQFRVKRIGADGTVLSNPFPAGVEPIGPIVAGAGAAWVPVEHGVLRFNRATGAYLGTVPAPDSDRIPRLVVIGSDVYAYSMIGSRLVELDASTPDASPVTSTDVTLLSVAATSRDAWALTALDGRTVVAPFDPTTGRFDRARALRLPREFKGSEIDASGDALWIQGRFDGRPAIVRLDVRDDGSVVAEQPVTLRMPTQSDLFASRGHELLVTADGHLYRLNVRP